MHDGLDVGHAEVLGQTERVRDVHRDVPVRLRQGVGVRLDDAPRCGAVLDAVDEGVVKKQIGAVLPRNLDGRAATDVEREAAGGRWRNLHAEVIAEHRLVLAAVLVDRAARREDRKHDA